jgi:hypothetical protein
MTINNQARFAKDIYQVPEYASESSSITTRQESDGQIDTHTTETAQRHIDGRFEEIVRAEENR